MIQIEAERQQRNGVVGHTMATERAGARGRKPRLLVIGPVPPPFIGPAVATDRLLRSDVIARAFDVDFVDTSDREGIEGIGRLNWHNISMALQHGLQCLRVLVFRRPDVVYISIDRAFWGFLRDMQFLVPAKVLGCSVLVHLRAGRFDLRHDFGRIGRAMASLGLFCARRALVLGEAVHDVFGPYASAEKIRLVPNGMNLHDWGGDLIPDRSARRDSTLRIAYIANLYSDKGAHVMISALPSILVRQPDVHVTFAGKWVGNDEYRLRCMDLVERHKLGDHVEFIAGVNEQQKKALLAEADLAVFAPVKPEGQPWVVLEAMAMGLPVIGTPQGTMSEMIIDGQTGFIVPSDDPGAIADRVVELARDRQLRLQLGRESRRRVEEVYAEEATHQRLVDVALESLRR